MAKPEDLARYRANLRSELDGAELYRAIAEAEPDPGRRAVLMELARAETRHAALWRDKLRAAGAPEPDFSPSLRTRLLAMLARRFGPRFVMPSLAAAEYADRDKYALQSDAAALSAGRQVVFGCAAAAVTYGIGRLLGVTLS